MTSKGKCFFTTIAVAATVLVFPALVNAAAIPITRERIASAMGAEGIAVSAEQITLLSNVVAAIDAPALKIDSIEPAGELQARVRLRCANATECLPFLVMVHSSQRGAWQMASWRAPRNEANSAKTQASAAVVRAGSSAVLLLEGGHVHIRIPVICLESGASGQTIRVASQDRKITYQAKVTDGALLRGKL